MLKHGFSVNYACTDWKSKMSVCFFIFKKYRLQPSEMMNCIDYWMFASVILDKWSDIIESD